MFIKKSFVDEIANSMERQLVDGVINKQAEKEEQLVKAANYLNAAAEIFDESGLEVQAEVVTAVLESLAAKKSKKNKKKEKPKAKSSKSKSPSSEKMVSNLKEKGWVFDENGADDTNFVDDNCALCGGPSKDMSSADDLKKKLWHLENEEDPNLTSSFDGSKEDLDERLHVTKPFGSKWKAHGPYGSHDELERKHKPHWFREDGSFKLYDDSEADDEDIEPEYWWRLVSLSAPRSYYDFKATESEAQARQEERSQYVGGECELEGPFTHPLKNTHHTLSLDEMSADDSDEPLDDQELMSMLDEFKTRSDDDFEDDEDLNNPDTFSEEAIHPDFKLNKVDLEDAAYPDLHEDPYKFNARRDPVQQKQDEAYMCMLDDEDPGDQERGEEALHQLRQEQRKFMGLPIAPRPAGPRGWDN